MRYLRFLQGFKVVPSLKGWLESLGYAVLVMAIAFLIAPSLVDFNQRPPLDELVRMSAIAFFVPALFEEAVFRGFLLLRFSPTWIALSSTAYVLWHPVEALTFFPQSAIYFLDIRFLLIVSLLSLFCTLAYFRTRSIWASVWVHWLVVVAWKAAGGAQFVV